MNLQDLVDGMNARMQRERAGSQMTLGQLIAALEAMPSNAVVANLDNAHSYRGYYCDLALERGEGNRTATGLLAHCRAAMGKVFEGWKGGDYVMGELTPVWVAEEGCCGQKLIALHDGGGMDTTDDD